MASRMLGDGRALPLAVVLLSMLSLLAYADEQRDSLKEHALPVEEQVPIATDTKLDSLLPRGKAAKDVKHIATHVPADLLEVNAKGAGSDPPKADLAAKSPADLMQVNTSQNANQSKKAESNGADAKKQVESEKHEDKAASKVDEVANKTSEVAKDAVHAEAKAGNKADAKNQAELEKQAAKEATEAAADAAEETEETQVDETAEAATDDGDIPLGPPAPQSDATSGARAKKGSQAHEIAVSMATSLLDKTASSEKGATEKFQNAQELEATHQAEAEEAARKALVWEQTGSQMLKYADFDKDGYATMPELMKYVSPEGEDTAEAQRMKTFYQNAFSKVDKNNDGLLDAKECGQILDVYMEEQRAARFAGMKLD